MDEPTSPPLGMLVRAVELPTPTNALVEHAARREHEAGRSLSCRAGCGACCRQMVPVSPPEAFYLMDVIESFEPRRRRAAMERFDHVVKVLEEREMIDELLDPALTPDPVLPVARQYFELGMPCPFLVAESCSIHPHRPVACRDYNVTSPAAWCAQPYEHEIAKVPMPLPLSVPLSRLTAALTGEKPCLLPLALVPRWVGSRADLRARQWPGPELFDRFVDELKSSYRATASDS